MMFPPYPGRDSAALSARDFRYGFSTEGPEYQSATPLEIADVPNFPNHDVLSHTQKMDAANRI
jgi:hypothetical protein